MKFIKLEYNHQRLTSYIKDDMPKHDIVVIGASAGGLEPLKKLISLFPSSLEASVFIVIHVEPHRKNFLTEILAKRSHLPVTTPENKTAIQKRHIYVAPPNEHLLLKSGKIILTKGPRINYFRPAIDVLFNSAANTYQSRVVGVLLSGLLDDGTSGLQDIKAQGGIAIVQDPREAEQPDMPLNALESTKIDYSLPVDQIAEVLIKLSKQKTHSSKIIQRNDASLIEEKAQLLFQTKEEILNNIGKASIFTCPECHGTLWELTEKNKLRYRCRIGHAYNIKSLMMAQNTSLENTLWAGIRALEETASLSHRIGNQLKKNNHIKAANYYFLRANTADEQAIELRKLLLLNPLIVEKNPINPGIKPLSN